MQRKTDPSKPAGISSVHYLLIAVYPVIALLAHNIEEIKMVVAVRSLVISILASVLIYLVLRAILKDGTKAALLTTITLGLFFSYGQIYDLLEQVSIFGLQLGRHRLLAPLWLIAFISFFLGIYRTKRPLKNWNSLFNLVTAVALVFPLWQIGAFAFRSLQASGQTINNPSTQSLHIPPGQAAPDVYYFILDAYARDDIMKESFDLDNTPFITALEQMGFTVARCSQSNYAQTQLSLSSSLNMDYLQKLDPNYSPGQTTRVGLEEWIRHSTVRRAFEGLGYTIVAFETGFKGTQWEDADKYLSPSSGVFQSMQAVGGPNSFEVMLLQTSAGLILSDAATALPKFLQADFNNPLRIHRDLILFDLDQLSKLPKIPGPKFVFAHLVIPHPPYVFGPNGEFIDYEKEYKPGYRDQVIYLNKRLLTLLPQMISDSSTPPIIILQGDHGPIGGNPYERMKNLNAYFLPGGGAQSLPQNITPVNSFRWIFNHYFGGSYPLLENTSYYSVYSEPFDFTIIQDKRAGCSQ
jgi:hypothetical protein